MTAITSAVLFLSESKGSGSTPMNALKKKLSLYNVEQKQRC